MYAVVAAGPALPVRRPLAVTLLAAATACLAAVPAWAALQMRAGNWVDIHRVDGELFGAMSRHATFSMAIVEVLAVALLLLGLAVAWGSRRARYAAAAAFIVTAYGLWHRGLYAADPIPSDAAATVCLLLGLALATWRGIDPYFDGRAWQQAKERRAWASYGKSARRVLDRIPLVPMALAVIGLGIVLRVATVWTMDIWADGSTYSAMGKAWMEHHEFLMPYGDVTTWLGSDPGYSHHYPPMYPLYLGVVYSIFGFGLLQTKLAGVAMAILALGVVFATTRSLFGRDRALLVTAILAMEPHLIWAAGTGFSENMVLVFFALTLWGILKSLDSPPYIVVAGAAAGLAYLTRSSIGPFFVVAGVGGLLWRFHFLGWRALSNRWYLAAIAVFVGLVAYWANRNVELFGGYPPWDGPASLAGPDGAIAWLPSSSGAMAAAVGGAALLGALFWMGRPRNASLAATRGYAATAVAAAALWVVGWAWLARNGDVHGWPPWETSTVLSSAGAAAAAEPREFAYALGYKSLLFLVYFLWYAVFFLPQIRESLRRIREESEMALWLAVGLVFVIAWLIASQLWVYESTLVFWFDNHRYIVIALLPLLWLALRRAAPREAGTKVRALALCLTLLLYTAWLFAMPTQTSTDEAMQSLAPHLEPGMEVAFDGGANKYSMFVYQPRYDIGVAGYPGGTCGAAEHPDFLIAVNSGDKEYPCFHEIGRFAQAMRSGGEQTSVVYKWGQPAA